MASRSPDGDADADADAAFGGSMRNLKRREARDDSGSGQRADGTGDVNGQGNKWWRPPFNDKATSLFLSQVTDTAVMGLVTLATFNATYLLAWGKPGTTCIPKLDNTTRGAVDKTSGPSWQQILSALLPFVVFPVTLYWSGVAKIAESDKRVLSAVAGACLCEFIFAIGIGALMSHCMAGAPGIPVSLVSVCLILVLGGIWVLNFKYPKFLCFRRGDTDEDERVIGEAAA